MPGRDGTGPFGQGPMTGGGFGYCRFQNVDAQNPYFRGGYGRYSTGRGFCRPAYGRGFRNSFFAANNFPNEKDFCESRIAFLKDELEETEKRLASLKTEEK